MAPLHQPSLAAQGQYGSCSATHSLRLDTISRTFVAVVLDFTMTFPSPYWQQKCPSQPRFCWDVLLKGAVYNVPIFATDSFTRFTLAFSAQFFWVVGPNPRSPFVHYVVFLFKVVKFIFTLNVLITSYALSNTTPISSKMLSLSKLQHLSFSSWVWTV